MVKFKMFYDSVLNGNLYDDFINRYPGDISREDVKQIMFKVLFSKNVCYSKYNKFIPYEDEKKVILYTNLARTDGLLFTKTILKQYLSLKDMKTTNYIRSLYRDLQDVKDLPMLIPEKDL